MEMEDNCMENDLVTMRAKVLCVQNGCLVVCDCCTGQRVVVHSEDACCFRPGDCVCIWYSGAMTMSMPPQISANCIKKQGRS